jgi:hypothetical protein
LSLFYKKNRRPIQIQIQMTDPLSPLVDLGVSLISESSPCLTSTDISSIRSLLQSFITGSLTYQMCVDGLSTFPGVPAALNRLQTILHTSDYPIPPIAGVALAGTKTHPWTAYEDQRLLAGVHRFGARDWQTVARFVGNGRSKAQCSQRWSRGLDPKIDKSAWSEQDDQQLLGLISRYGEGCWTAVSREIGNRSDVQCRYRYTQLQKQEGFVVPVTEKPPDKAKAITPIEVPARVEPPVAQVTPEPISFAEVPLDEPNSPRGSGFLKSSDSTSFLFGFSPLTAFKYEP